MAACGASLYHKCSYVHYGQKTHTHTYVYMFPWIEEVILVTFNEFQNYLIFCMSLDLLDLKKNSSSFRKGQIQQILFR